MHFFHLNKTLSGLYTRLTDGFNLNSQTTQYFPPLAQQKKGIPAGIAPYFIVFKQNIFNFIFTQDHRPANNVTIKWFFFYYFSIFFVVFGFKTADRYNATCTSLTTNEIALKQNHITSNNRHIRYHIYLRVRLYINIRNVNVCTTWNEIMSVNSKSKFVYELMVLRTVCIVCLARLIKIHWYFSQILLRIRFTLG